MATTMPGMPPTPPDVVAQQMPSSLRFMQAAGSNSMAQQGQQFDSMAFVSQKMNEVASALSEVAQVLVVDKPVLMKPLELMIKAGSMISNAIQESAPQQPAPESVEAPPPEGGPVS